MGIKFKRNFLLNFWVYLGGCPSIFLSAITTQIKKKKRVRGRKLQLEGRRGPVYLKSFCLWQNLFSARFKSEEIIWKSNKAKRDHPWQRFLQALLFSLFVPMTDLSSAATSLSETRVRRASHLLTAALTLIRVTRMLLTRRKRCDTPDQKLFRHGAPWKFRLHSQSGFSRKAAVS